MRNPGSARPFHEVKLGKGEQVLDFILSQWESRHRDMQALEQQWTENIAFYLGHQWSEFHPRLRRMVERAKPAARVRLVINRLLPMVTRKIATIVRGKPTWKAKPATNDYDDVSVARLSTKVLQGYWETLGMQKKLIELALWCETTGTAFIKTAWDPFLGPLVSAGQEELPGGGDSLQALLGMFGEGPQKEVLARIGDACVEIRSPFEIMTDSGSSKFEDVIWVHDVKAVPVTWLMNRYPGKKFEPDANEAKTQSRYYIDQVQSLSESPESIYQRPAVDTRDRIILHQLWTCPTREYPDGYYAVAANERILKHGGSPYVFPDHLKGPPYDCVTALPVPGRIHGTCSLRHSISPQTALNSARSHLEEIRRRMARPKWFVVEGSGVQDSQLTGERSAEIVTHAMGMQPKADSPPPLPEWLMRMPGEARNDIDDISSQHAATQGQQPGSVRSGSGIETLVETDAAGNIVTLDSFREGLQKCGSRLLSILARNVTEDRIVTLAGEEFGSVETILFKGGALTGRHAGTPGVNYNNVSVEMIASGPLTSTGQMNQVTRLVEAQVLHPQADRDKIFRMLDLGFSEPYLDEAKSERGNISRENVLMVGGQFPPTEPFDNDAYHIREHRRFQKNPEYRSVPPQNRQIFEAHIMQHTQKLFAQMYNQQMGQGAVPPAQAQANPGRSQAAAQSLRTGTAQNVRPTG